MLGSPQPDTETSNQKQHHSAPIYHVPFQSENSAFDRVYKQPSPYRQPMHGYIQPANVAPTPKLISRTQSDNVMVSAFTTSLKNPRAVNDVNIEKSRKINPGLTSTIQPFKLANSTGKLYHSLDETPTYISHDHKQRHEERLESKDQLMHVSPIIQPPKRSPEIVGKSEVPVYQQSGTAAHPSKLQGQAKEVSSMKHRMLVRSMSDSTGTQKMEVFKIKESEVQDEMVFLGTEDDAHVANEEAGTVNTKVSVAQLRSAYMETASSSKRVDQWVTFASF